MAFYDHYDFSDDSEEIHLDSEDEETPFSEFHDRCKNYNVSCRYIQNSEKDFKKLYMIINIIEKTFDVPEEDCFQGRVNFDKYKVHRISGKKIANRFDEDYEKCIEYIKPLQDNINKMENEVFRHRMSVCKYLRELSDLYLDEGLNTWGEIESFLKSYEIKLFSKYY